MRYIIAAALLVGSAGPAAAQTTLKYEATIGLDGKVALS
jgi:hypothetical protein